MGPNLTCHRCSIKQEDVFEFAPAGGRPTCVVCMGLVDSNNLHNERRIMTKTKTGFAALIFILIAAVIAWILTQKD